jgi:hypothetical protein
MMTHFKAIAEFLRDYEAGTAESRRGRRLWRGKVRLHVEAYYGHACLKNIEAVVPRQGYGTAALRWLLLLASEHGVAVIGHASNGFHKGTDKPSVLVLRRWYRSLGARFDRHGAFVFWPKEVV